MNLSSLFPTVAAIPEHCRIKPAHQRDFLLGGEIRAWTGASREVLSPVCIRNEQHLIQAAIGSYPSCGPEIALEALDAACRAWNGGRGDWPCMTVGERIACVAAFAARMKEKRDEVARMLMWEIGKTLPDSLKEFDRTLDYIADTIEAVKELDRSSSRFQIVQGVAAQIRRAPLGVALCMGPFNYPLNETFTTLIPALIMGNPVLFKPAKHGVLLLQPLLDAFRDCFPPGVVNTLYGDGRALIGPIMESGRLDVLAFIGGANTANILQKQHPRPNRLRTVLGLNAKNPAIVLDDADLELAVKECVLGALSFNGQRCTALKIIFVQRGIIGRFLPAFSDAVDALRIGMPWDEGVQITPLPEEGKTAWLTSFVEDALAKGAQVINQQGGAVCETLFKPAVLYPVSAQMRLFQEEQFGPVVPIVPFDDVSEIIDFIVASPFGQQASLFSSDPARIGRLLDPLTNQFCRVNLNCQCQRGPDVFPFTGRKDSAEGTLSVSDALRVFSIRTLVAAKSNPLNNGLLSAIVRDRQSKFLNTDFIF